MWNSGPIGVSHRSWPAKRRNTGTGHDPNKLASQEAEADDPKSPQLASVPIPWFWCMDFLFFVTVVGIGQVLAFIDEMPCFLCIISPQKDFGFT